MKHLFINRDISWLSFNERVLLEASRPGVPLLERLRFLSIYSSNLDEFYRVRMPALIALQKMEAETAKGRLLHEVNSTIARQQQQFGRILREELLPLLAAQHIHFIYREPVPLAIKESTKDYFLSCIAAFLQPVQLSSIGSFFPENNRIYFAISIRRSDRDDIVLANIPAAECGRFYTETVEGTRYVLTIDDIIRDNLAYLVPDAIITGCYSFKITRDAELELEDEFKDDIAERIEAQINLRDQGLATRMLYDAAMPFELMQQLITAFQLGHATIVEGGSYHNLKDLADFPVKQEALSYPKWPQVHYPLLQEEHFFAGIDAQDLLLHVPYHSYATLLQCFNQAALDPFVTDISITLYRIAGDSLIAHALISAAKNGKNVTVFVELKARFDEANNIRWAKRMKAAGIKIIYSIPGLKVHAKVALIKRKEGERSRYYGVLATGNFNESTARFYTDHILITAKQEMLRELELLFLFLARRKKPGPEDQLRLQHLLIAQFNLQETFLRLIDNEIESAGKGQPAAITIKLNNLEEEVMIRKLYEASQAGVRIRLIVRGICRLRPGVPGLSEHISVRRIVDRFLEHGRIFIFHNRGQPRVFLGSADWMNRNIYRRIEVCFPVYDNKLKQQLIDITAWQLDDTASAVALDENGQNGPLPPAGEAGIRSQYAIYQMIQSATL